MCRIKRLIKIALITAFLVAILPANPAHAVELIGVRPIIVSEWGYEDNDVAYPTGSGSQSSYGHPFTQWMESSPLSNLAWRFHRDWTPASLKPDGGLALYGASVKNHISSSSLMTLDPAKISFQEVASGLDLPVFITNADDGSGRIFIVERAGRIRIIKNGALLTTPFLDIQSMVMANGGEQGLLALAFHPSYSSNGVFFVAYTAPRNGDPDGSNLILEKFSVSPSNPDQANPSTGNILLNISHPTYPNHNGGTLAFGQDGYLYWSTGDGGYGGDPNNNAQQLNNLLGKILRIDVNSALPYSIPDSNPFFSSIDPTIRKEIWAYGLRNPWRLSFDALTYDLYIGDVGQGAREEIDFQSAGSMGGENYGWRVMEGSLCYNPASGCDQNGKVLPVAEYDHTTGCAVTGGYVYRGSNFPSLYGHYFYGDYCSGILFDLYQDMNLEWQTSQLVDTPFNISTFGEDEQKELYVADYIAGKIYNIRYQEDVTITGNTGIAGATLSYMHNGLQTVTADESGNYAITVPGGWTGTVTPSFAGDAFCPEHKTYSNLLSHQTLQNYAHTACQQYNALSLWTTDFSYYPQGWRADLHPRELGDVDGDGMEDIVGFGYGGVLVALSNGTGFDPLSLWTSDFSYNQGWRMDTYPRMVGDVNGDGKDDVVGFGYAGAAVALSNGSSFEPLSLWTSDFSYYPQGWRANLHPRELGDVNGDGMEDIVGFGYGGVLVALSNGSGFDPVSNWTTDFSYNQGWRMDTYPRLVGDVNGDGMADLVGFGYAGAAVALSNGSSFAPLSLWTTEFSHYPQGWRVALHPRVVGDVNGDGKADIIGFGYGGVLVSLSTGNGFALSTRVTEDFSYNQGWRVELYPRLVGDASGDGKADLVGFGHAGVLVATAK